MSAGRRPRVGPTLVLAVALAAPIAARAHLFIQRDVETLIAQAEFVVRVKITSATLPDAEDVPPTYRARAVTQLKGKLPTDIQFRGAGHHPPRYARGDDEIVFLIRAPSQTGGSDLASIQGGGERWDAGAGGTGIEAFLRDIAAAPTGTAGRSTRFRLYVAALRGESTRLAAHACTRLGVLGREAAFTPAELDAIGGVLGDDSVAGRTRAALLGALGATLPAERAVDLVAGVKDPVVRAALLSSIAQGAWGPVAESARAALGTERSSPSADVSLAAAVGLAQMGDEAALPALREFLVAGDATARLEVTSALAALARRGSAAARAELRVLRADSDRAVGARARRLYKDVVAASPERRQRTRPSLYAAGAALVLLLAAAAMAARGAFRPAGPTERGSASDASRGG